MIKVKKGLKISFIIISCLILIALAVGFSYIFKISKQVKYNDNILINANAKVDIYDNSNCPISYINEQENKVKINELPSYIPASFISIEDKTFYNHKGLNYKRMAKAMYNNLKSMSAKEGASTISQQLIKNTYLSNEKTIERKIKEMLLTKKMEKNFTKEQILETYLNVIYFGNNSYGLEEASKNYFNKPAKNLTLSETAILAGLIKSPKLYSPIYNKENCIKRRNLVLTEMLKDKVITKQEYETAIKEDISLKLNNEKVKNFYEQAVMQEASEILNLSEKDIAKSWYQIFTYLDSNDQLILKDAINNKQFYHVNSCGKIADSCGIIIDSKTGGITAFGGKSIYDLVNMKRSPGSTIKPILVYAPALEIGVISPSTPILDEKMDFNGYSPKNVGNKYYGYISARKTLEKSLNIPAIKIMQYASINKCKEMAKKAGVNLCEKDNNYAIALGGLTNGLTVKELVNTYIPLSNNGNFIKAKFIRKICDKNGKLLYENKQNFNKIMSEETAYLLTDMLKSSTKTGTSSRLKNLNFDIAGKTGTVGYKNTNLNLDVWSVAYTSDKVCGIWLGNSTNTKEYMLEGCNNGGTYCSSMINNIFENLYKTEKPKKFNKPARIKEVIIDSIELENNHVLKLADENTPEIFTEKAIFNAKFMPRDIATSFSELSVVKLKINLKNNKIVLSFNALPQCEYKIYRIEEDTTKLLTNIKNKQGKVEFLDETAYKDTQYEYYVEAIAKNHTTNSYSKKIKSNSVKIFNPSIINSKNIFNNNFSFA